MNGIETKNKNWVKILTRNEFADADRLRGILVDGGVKAKVRRRSDGFRVMVLEDHRAHARGIMSERGYLHSEEAK